MMICTRCGRTLAAGTSFCEVCKAPGMAAMRGAAGWTPPAATSVAAADAVHGYAGFWLRFLAYLIDSVVVGAGGLAVVGVASAAVGILMGAAGAKREAIGAVGGFSGLVLSIAVNWLYFALMESSARQATLGKMALGLAVADDAGHPIGFWRATARTLGKIVSAFPLCIGYLMAGFTGRKQALHDMIAGTVVTKRRETGAAVVVGVVVGGALLLVLVVGVLAAIAVPNFLRYQLRAKSIEATGNLALIARIEQAQHARASRYVAFALPRGTPGPTRMAWTPDETALATRMGWPAGAATYFTYRVEVGATPDGKQAYSACAEADLDGDGAVQAVVLWQPVLDAAGQVVALPPDPPCTHDPLMDRSARYEVGDPIGTPVKISPAAVF